MRSTTPSELIEGLRRLRVPDAVVIPLAVMLRFFPTLTEELTAVIQAVRLRRLHTGRWGFLREPLVAIEHIMVPFLVSATRSAMNWRPQPSPGDWAARVRAPPSPISVSASATLWA